MDLSMFSIPEKTIYLMMHISCTLGNVMVYFLLNMQQCSSSYQTQSADISVVMKHAFRTAVGRGHGTQYHVSCFSCISQQICCGT